MRQNCNIPHIQPSLLQYPAINAYASLVISGLHVLLLKLFSKL